MNFVKKFVVALLLLVFGSVLNAAPVGVNFLERGPQADAQFRTLEFLDLTENEKQIDAQAKLPVDVAEAEVDAEPKIEIVKDVEDFTVKPPAVEVPMIKKFAEEVRQSVQVSWKDQKAMVDFGEKPQMKVCGLMIMVFVVAVIFGIGKVVVGIRNRISEYLSNKEKEGFAKSKQSGFTVDDVFEDVECPKRPTDIFADII